MTVPSGQSWAELTVPGQHLRSGTPPSPGWYVEAPNAHRGPEPCLFLAGGITHCPDWQAEAVALLSEAAVVVLNPRRRLFDVSNRAAADGQIRWEYEHLKRADVVLFWFCAGPSAQPIALYELGAMAAAGKRIAVGAHPDYSRRTDIRVQLALSRPELAVHGDLAGTVAAAVAALPG